MPIWGTSDYPPHKISTGYARTRAATRTSSGSTATAPMFPWTELSSAPTEEGFRAMARDSAERYRAAVVDMRRLVDWAATRPEIDADRIAFVGFSMSALVTATLLANEPRIAGGVLMMGAARFADVFALCRNRAGEVREHVMRTFGWTIDEYREFFRVLFDPADPMRFEGRYDPTKILMIDAMFDDCMPESSRAALWEITGHPRARDISLSAPQRVLFADAARSQRLAPQDLPLPRRETRAQSRRPTRAIDINLSRFCVTCASRLQRHGASAIVGPPIKGKPDESRGHKASGLTGLRPYDSGVAGHSSTAFARHSHLSFRPAARNLGSPSAHEYRRRAQAQHPRPAAALDRPSDDRRRLDADRDPAGV